MKYIVICHKKDIYEAALEGGFKVLECYNSKQAAMRRIKSLQFRYNTDEYDIFMREFDEKEGLCQELFKKINGVVVMDEVLQKDIHEKIGAFYALVETVETEHMASRIYSLCRIEDVVEKDGKYLYLIHTVKYENHKLNKEYQKNSEFGEYHNTFTFTEERVPIDSFNKCNYKEVDSAEAESILNTLHNHFEYNEILLFENKKKQE